MKKLTGAKVMVGIPNVCADILYATGFKASDPIVVLDHRGERTVVVTRMEVGRARMANPRLSVLTPEDLGLPASKRKRLSAWVGALLKRVGVRRALVPRTFPLGLARDLERRGLHLVVADEGLCPERIVKTREEIGRIRCAQKAAVRAFGHAVSMLRNARVDSQGVLRDGHAALTAEGVRQAINHVLLDNHCAGGEPIVACGPLSANPHWIGYGPLKAGQPIVFDIFPQDLETGYWGDLTRTVVKGQPAPALARMYRVVKQVQAEALATIRAGVRTGAVHRRVTERFKSLGYETRVTDGIAEGFIHGTGHGVGLEIHEAPSLGRGETVLRPGHVITVEPGLYYRDLGGIRIEDTVVVTATGYEFLAACPRQLVIR